VPLSLTTTGTQKKSGEEYEVSLNKIWKHKSISRRTKTRLLRSLVIPIATYASECWVMKKNDRARIHVFEIWAYRSLLEVSWTEKR